MKKITTFFAVLVLTSIFAASLMAQPQYYNYENVGGSNNSFPLGQAAGKQVQWLFLAGDFNQPTPIPAGKMITKLYVYTTYTASATYTDLTIKLGQTNDVELTTGTFYTGQLDTVYYKASVSLSSTANAWMEIVLDQPFVYDNTKSLVVDISQCSMTGSAINIRQNALSGVRRVWSVQGCPFVPYAGGDASMVNLGVDVVDVPSFPPELIYYKFEENPTLTSVKNCASAPVGTNPATLTGSALTDGGQFDTCITSTGIGSDGVTTGWNCDLGASSWTISMWLTIPSSASGSAYYLFGDPGSNSFRCFHNGVAGPDNLILRGPLSSDVTVTGIGPDPTVVTFVYDATIPDIKAYKNGVLAVTSPQTAINMTTGSGFKVGGYSSSLSFIGKMDEFRLYNRALDATEILNTYNQDIACYSSGVGITNFNNNTFELLQNYPNPFNKTTTISYNLVSKSDVMLKVYDIMGKEVTTLVNANQASGKHEVVFDASNLASGIYVYQLITNNFSKSKRMMLEK